MHLLPSRLADHLNSLHERISENSSSSSSSSIISTIVPRFALEKLITLFQQFQQEPKNPLILLASSVVITVLVAIAVMSSHRRYASHHRRPLYNVPKVTEHDYTYIRHDGSPPPSFNNNGDGNDEDEEGPDIILLQHRGTTYPLHFAPFAISDGRLSVGYLRQRAAEETETKNSEHVKLLYKGKVLKDDRQPCKAEGLKQESKVMCVITEVPNESSTSSEGEEEDDGGGGGSDCGGNLLHLHLLL